MVFVHNLAFLGVFNPTSVMVARERPACKRAFMPYAAGCAKTNESDAKAIKRRLMPHTPAQDYSYWEQIASELDNLDHSSRNEQQFDSRVGTINAVSKSLGAAAAPITENVFSVQHAEQTLGDEPDWYQDYLYYHCYPINETISDDILKKTRTIAFTAETEPE